MCQGILGAGERMLALRQVAAEAELLCRSLDNWAEYFQGQAGELAGELKQLADEAEAMRAKVLQLAQEGSGAEKGFTFTSFAAGHHHHHHPHED